MNPFSWAQAREVPPWLWALEPSTTGLLGQEGTRLWTWNDAGALGIRAGGVVYPVFHTVPDEALEAAREVLAKVGDSWCVMGPSPWVDRTEALMPPSVVTHRVDYEFLQRPAGEAPVNAGPGVLRRAGPSDANALFGLQEGYEKEEVLFQPGDFQPLASRLHLGKSLKSQVIVGLWENGHPVAKAGTNALTPRWAQIGGVYTRPDRRGQGHQRRLMAYLLSQLAAQGRGTCLFVKTHNAPALALYRGLGFGASGAFRITYGSRR